MNAPPSRPSPRPLLEELDHVGAVLGLVEMVEHLRPGHEGLRIGEPAVERLFVPDEVRMLQRIGIGVVGQRSGLAAEHAAMARADVVLVERMAVLATLVELFAMCRVTGGAGG